MSKRTKEVHLGKRYYAGVPAINEVPGIGPVVSSAVRSGISTAQKHHQQGSTMPVSAMIMVMLIGFPILPIWAGPMLISEVIKSRKLDPGTEEYAQNQVNIKLAGICFFVGVVIWSAFSPW